MEEIGEKKQGAISEIKKQEESSIGNVTEHADTEIQRIQNQTSKSKSKLESTIEQAANKNTKLEESIQTAGEQKVELDKSIESAGEQKAELINSVNAAEWTKTGLDESIQTASNKKAALDTTIGQANIADASLKKQIGSAEKIQENVEQIDKNKNDVVLLKEDLSNKITKFYTSNQGETHITDSDNGKITDMMVFGKSAQEKHSGAQLFCIPDNFSYNNMGIKCKADIDGIYVQGTSSSNEAIYLFRNKEFPFKAGTYTLSITLIGKYTFKDSSSINVRLGYKKPISISAKLGKATFSLANEDKIEYAFISIPEGAVVDGFVQIMLNSGSEALSYEPYTGGIPSPSPDYPQDVKSVVNPVIKIDNNGYLQKGSYFKDISIDEPYKEQSITLPYTLNAIQATSGGDYTDENGQQWIRDEVDCERGVYIQRIKKYTFSGDETVRKSGTYQPGGAYTHETIRYQYNLDRDVSGKNFSILCSHFGSGRYATNVVCSYDGYVFFFAKSDDFQTENDFSNFLKQQKNDGHPVELFYILATPIETPLTSEEINALKSLSTNYPVTNISVNSEQLDGYTVFNYPISMANGWNYVKQQLNDNRDYIYDMDLQSAEAYVNSEYDVALTELEVM